MIYQNDAKEYVAVIPRSTGPDDNRAYREERNALRAWLQENCPSHDRVLYARCKSTNHRAQMGWVVVFTERNEAVAFLLRWS